MCLNFFKSETYTLVIISSINFSGLQDGTAKYFLKYYFWLTTLWCLFSLKLKDLHSLGRAISQKTYTYYQNKLYISNIQNNNKARLSDQLHTVGARTAIG